MNKSSRLGDSLLLCALGLAGCITGLDQPSVDGSVVDLWGPAVADMAVSDLEALTAAACKQAGGVFLSSGTSGKCITEFYSLISSDTFPCQTRTVNLYQSNIFKALCSCNCDNTYSANLNYKNIGTDCSDVSTKISAATCNSVGGFNTASFDNVTGTCSKSTVTPSIAGWTNPLPGPSYCLKTPQQHQASSSNECLFISETDTCPTGYNLNTTYSLQPPTPANGFPCDCCNPAEFTGTAAPGLTVYSDTTCGASSTPLSGACVNVKFTARAVAWNPLNCPANYTKDITANLASSAGIQQRLCCN